ncbi:amidohydrolase family protein [Iamia majanohamensis]|uniref:Amidohydrolase family protein n=1 Tax=Iamia majanohamensis TaxID=467976 RepID=A0AAE9Y6C6_9ACTN|nr:amidohydrolase family protein [Iamia majanohamensis]WCO67500.1 amidohydrolase family protein [Iamia majanohamensis]
MAHDLVITGGTVVDGTGAPGRRADVAVDGDRITAVGEVDAGGAGRVIDAEGRTVTPGFVDLHSHLDAQIGWDPLMSSSCYHGVTSVVMGNCGMTFAPVRPGQAEVLAGLMESVEDIPASSILDGLDWGWESYADYLDAIDGVPKGINAGGYVGDVALRTYVAGDASCERDFGLTDDQQAEMTRLVGEAVEAGAFGYSISRSLTHRTPDGRSVPGTWANPTEFVRTATALRALGRGAVECAPRYNEEDGSSSRVDEEMAWIAEVSRTSGRPFSFNLMQMRSMGDHYRRVLELAEQANAEGAQLRPQTTPRAIGVLFSLAASSLVDDLPGFQAARELDLGGRLAAIRDPELRARLVEEGRDKPVEPFQRMYLMRPDPGAVYEYGEGDSIAAQAAARGMTPIEHYLDVLDETDGQAVVNWPVLNEDFDAISELLASPVTIMGLADAGAHATQIMDASQPTFFLSHWVRDRGELTLEDAVRRLTSDTASFIGFKDRGVLRPGAYADVNVLDLDAMWLPLPEIVHDFPGGAPRFVQRATGIDHTIVNGVPFLEGGEHTGGLGGRLLRSTD